MDLNNILFAPLDLPPPDKECIDQVCNADWENLSHWDEYRACRLMPLYMKGGLRQETESIRKSDLKLDWIQGHQNMFPKLQKYCDENIFPWMNKSPRLIVIRTPAGAKNNLHVDASRADCLQQARAHKFRIVLRGNVSSLIFHTKQGLIRPSDASRAFIMDGAWPHSMENDLAEDKITLAAGWPWIGDETPGYRSLLERSKAKFGIMERNSYEAIELDEAIFRQKNRKGYFERKENNS